MSENLNPDITDLFMSHAGSFDEELPELRAFAIQRALWWGWLRQGAGT